MRRDDLVGTLKALAGIVDGVAFSPAGGTVAAGSRGGAVAFWDARRFSPHESILAAGGEAGTVQLWAVPAGKRLETLNGATGPVFSVAFSPDGRTLAAGGFLGTISVWRSVA